MIGDRIRELRKKKGVTQEQLAAIIGVERSSIGKYEGKQHIVPSDEVKVKLAEYFGSTLDYLCGVESAGSEEPAFQVSGTEKAIILAYRQANPSIQQAVCDILHVESAGVARKNSAAG